MGINLTSVVRRFVPEEWGGIETLVVNISNQLAERGFGVKLYTTDSMSTQRRETVKGLDVHRFSYFYPYLGLRGERWAAFDRKGGNSISFPMFFALLRDKQVDIVQLFAMNRLGAMVATACRLKGIPYIVNIQGGFSATAPQEEIDMCRLPVQGTLDWGKPFGALFGTRRFIDHADAIACAGGQDYQYARERYPDKPVYLLPCCVDTAYFSKGERGAFKKKYGLDGKRILLSVGRIDTQKNQKLIVEALPGILGEFEDAFLVLIGAVTIRDYCNELKELIAKLGLDGRVLLIEGLKPGDPDLLNAYADCDVFVLASIQECGATVVLEAMSAGRPVVASNAGGLPWIVNDGHDGLLFESGDADGLIRQVTRLLRDGKLRESITRAGRAAATERFDWRVVADLLARICEEAIAAKRRKIR